MLVRTEKLSAEDLARCQLAFDTLDTDGSGTLSAAEVDAVFAVYDTHSDSLGALTAAEVGSVATLVAEVPAPTFAADDADGNGALSPSEGDASESESLTKAG